MSLLVRKSTDNKPKKPLHPSLAWWGHEFPRIAFKYTGNEVPQSSQSPRVVNGVLGESATLLLELPAGKEASLIIWHHKGEASQDTTILIVQLNKSKTPRIIESDPKRGERLSIIQSYSLQVNNLTMADAGLYRAQITTKDPTPDFSIYKLRVFGESKYII
ncbi:SLAM family member 6-like protein [Cricetulus griseus]|nr:SLAM family member 6-like protein [Cricetulus griseus]